MTSLPSTDKNAVDTAEHPSPSIESERIKLTFAGWKPRYRLDISSAIDCLATHAILLKNCLANAFHHSQRAVYLCPYLNATTEFSQEQVTTWRPRHLPHEALRMCQDTVRGKRFPNFEDNRCPVPTTRDISHQSSHLAPTRSLTWT